MSHLKNFGVGNFRAFKDFYNFDFAPITVLTGTNSSGKSSLIKAILSIQEALKNKPKNVTFPFLQFNIQQDLNIGNYSTVKNDLSEDPEIKFEFTVKFGMLKDEFKFRLSFIKGMTASLEQLVLKHFYLTHLASGTNVISLYRIEDKYKIEIKFSYIYELYSTQGLLKTLDNGINEGPLTEWINPYGKYSIPKPLLNYWFFEEEEVIQKKAILISENVNEGLDLLNAIKEAKLKIRSLADKLGTSPEELVLKWELYRLDSTGYSLGIQRQKDMNKLGIDPMHLVKHMQDTYTSFDESMLKTNRLTKVLFGIYDGIYGNDYQLINPLQELDNFKELEKLLNLDLVNTPVETNCLGDEFIKQIEFDFEGVMKGINHCFLDINYVSSVRTKVDRIYRIGTKESSLHEILHQYLNTYHFKKAKEFIENVCKHTLQIADEIKINSSPDSSFAEIILVKNGRERKLADYGYGISQLIPVLLKINIVLNAELDHRANFENEGASGNLILIIEEPETNLHPKLQSKLADILVEAAKGLDIQFIIETHSEYLIRKLQYLTAKKEITPEFTQLYYFYPPDDVPKVEKQIKKINILKDGRLSAPFGQGFYDESARLMTEIMNLNFN